MFWVPPGICEVVLTLLRILSKALVRRHPTTNLCKVAAACCLLLLSPAQARGEAAPEAEPFGLIGRVLGAVFSGDKGNKGNKGNGGGDGGGGGGDLTDGYGAPSSGYGAPVDS